MGRHEHPPKPVLRILAFLEYGSPAFEAMAGATPVRIMLQSSVIAVLLNGGDSKDLVTTLELSRPKILAAAQRLYEDGFFCEVGDHLEIILTALDF